MRARGEDKYTHRPRIPPLGSLFLSRSGTFLALRERVYSKRRAYIEKFRYRTRTESGSGERGVGAWLLQNVVKLWIVKRLYEFVLFAQASRFLSLSATSRRSRTSPCLSHLRRTVADAPRLSPLPSSSRSSSALRSGADGPAAPVAEYLSQSRSWSVRSFVRAFVLVFQFGRCEIKSRPEDTGALFARTSRATRERFPTCCATTTMTRAYERTSERQPGLSRRWVYASDASA